MNKHLMQKKDMNKSEPPAELLEIIEAANLIPFGTELKTRKFEDLHLDENPQKCLEELLNDLSEFRLLVDYLKTKTDQIMRDYVDDDKEIVYTKTFITQLDKYKKDRIFLKSVVGIARKYNNHLEEVAGNHQKYDSPIEKVINIARQHSSPKKLEEIRLMFSVLYPPFKVSSQHGGLKWYEAMLEPSRKGLGGTFFESAIDYMVLTTDEEHHIQIKPFGLLQLIQSCDLRLFKQCLVCQKFIWANRRDRKFCSRRCSNAGSQRIYQSDDKKRKKYNERRVATYHSKKELAKGKTKSK